MIQDPNMDIKCQTRAKKFKNAVIVEVTLKHKRTQKAKNSIDKIQKL